ncbi:hypothetical protein J5T34_05750 [Cupriavidus gilardii]|uniref:hypothetical protein n=1 Tax=Cupriavidus gilardii TaxID=82541 RepID=UPI001ABE95FA|nr:hypothetical protein [Cupriavidus gilardii]MBO4120242.1 hypothetical protein [Cupriavidus gilardii]
MGEMKPCPFCGDDGEKGEVEMTEFPSRNQYKVIKCYTCGASCPAANWNTRAPVEGPKPNHATFADWQAFHDSMRQAGATEQEIAEALAARDETGAGTLASAIGGLPAEPRTKQ